jgi:hypothetical protein
MWTLFYLYGRGNPYFFAIFVVLQQSAANSLPIH